LRAPVEQLHQPLVLSCQFDFPVEIVNPDKYEFVAVRRTKDHTFLFGFFEQSVDRLGLFSNFDRLQSLYSLPRMNACCVPYNRLLQS